MSFIFFLICLALFISSSYEDIFKLNPISSKSEIVDSEPKKIIISKEKIWIPFRMVNYDGKFVDHRDILYILPYFVEGKYDNETGMNLKYNLLSYKLCNETSMINKENNYKIDIELNESFCIDTNDIPFGGSWNGKFINYIEVNLFLCKDGIDLNISDPRCSKLDSLQDNSWILEIYYPIIQFQPTNLETPMAVIYRSYFYRLNGYGSKVQRLYLQEHILSDDKGSIISKYKNTSFWGTSTLYGDDYYLPYNNISINKNISSRIYSLNIYMNEGYIYYTRTYKKIFLVIANFVPLIRIVLYFFNKVTQHIKMSFVKRKLAELIFENKEKSKSSLIKLRMLNNNNLSKNNKIITKKKDKKKNKNKLNEKNKKYNNIDIKKSDFEDKNKDIFLNNNSFNKSNLSLNSDNVIKILNKKEIELINSKNKSFSMDKPIKKEISQKNIKITKNSNRKKYLFSYLYFFLDFLFDKLVKPQKFCFLSKTYFTVYNFMCQIYDISNYIILFRQFNVLNSIIKKIFEKDGFYTSKQFTKINVNDNDIISKVNKELKSEKSILFSNYL